MADLNPEAAALNQHIAQSAPAVIDMLSERGKRIFFPSKGIVAQTAEAKGKAINATVGIAYDEDGTPLRLPTIAEKVALEPAQAFAYAPSQGCPELRATWREMILAKNPGLAGKAFSKPIVTCALTHGLMVAGYMFVDPGDRLITPELFWGNYKLIFANGWDAAIVTYPMFDGNGFHVEGLREALRHAGKKCIVSLNFPNNPTGYTVTEAEAEAVTAALVEAADAGTNIVAVMDDAYFGLVYADGILGESLFARLADAHERILAVKVDGATKEDYAWGFRVGFLTYGIKGADADAYAALEAKTAGTVRGTVSNAPRISQELVLAAYRSGTYAEEKAAAYALLKGRYDRVRQILADNPHYAEEFEALPFNSGYFMCVKAKKDPEAIRQLLLAEYSTGVIAAAAVVRLAFSAVPTDQLETLFENLYQACKRA